MSVDESESEFLWNLEGRAERGEITFAEMDAIIAQRTEMIRKKRELDANHEAHLMREAWKAMGKIATEHGFVLRTIAEPGSQGLAVRWDTMRLEAKS